MHQTSSRQSMDYAGFRPIAYSHRSLASERHNRRPFIFSRAGLVAVVTVVVVSGLIAGALLLENRIRDSEHEHVPVEEPRLGTKIRTTLLISGPPHSGTSLMRAVLGLHPNIFCKGESIDLFEYLQNVTSGKADRMALGHVLDNKAPITSKIKPTANVSCDSIQNQNSNLLIRFFKSRRGHTVVIIMIRDPRSTLPVGVVEMEGYRRHFEAWNKDTENRFEQCESLGNDTCIMIRYEDLVMNAKDTLSKILDFLSVPWSDSVIHRRIKKPASGILGELEVNFEERLEPLYSPQVAPWVGRISEDVLDKIYEWAPLMKQFGYHNKIAADQPMIVAALPITPDSQKETFSSFSD